MRVIKIMHVDFTLYPMYLQYCIPETAAVLIADCGYEVKVPTKNNNQCNNIISSAESPPSPKTSGFFILPTAATDIRQYYLHITRNPIFPPYTTSPP